MFLMRWWKRILLQGVALTLICIVLGQTFCHFKRTYTPSYREPENQSSVLQHQQPLIPDNDDLNWVVQVSDLHFSKFRGPTRPTDFEALCRYLKSNVDPSALVITGDLTDSKGVDHFSSELYKEEWLTYSSVMRGACAGINVLDVKGNHDVFDVPEEDRDKLFQSYSSRGKKHSRSYLETVTLKGSGKRRLGLVAIDATPVPGLKRPFNFFGTLAEKELQRIQRLLETSKTLHSDYTLFFGHYPTGTVLTSDSSDSLRELLSGGVYLCGHLHNFIGAADRMYTMHPNSNLLELELADWKDNRKYRILAFDQGFLSFSDAQFKSDGKQANTALIVTSPKDPLFLTKNESVRKMRRIRHIRVLVFSDRKIINVTMNGGSVTMSRIALMTKNLTAERSPLFTSPFHPGPEELRGLHDLTFTVYLADGTTHEQTHRYSLDGTQPEFDFFSGLLLLSDWLTATELLFACACISVVGFLVVMRLVHELRLNADVKRMREATKTKSWIGRFVAKRMRRYWMVAAVDKICFPVIGYVVCTSIFPLALGHVMTNRHALIFVWGIVFTDDLSYIPPDLTFFYGIISVGFVIGPLVLVLANEVEVTYMRLDPSRRQPEKQQSYFGYMCFPLRHFGIIVLTVVQVLLTRELTYAYGLVSMFSPIGLGRIALCLWLYWSAQRLGKEDFREVYQIWPYH